MDQIEDMRPIINRIRKENNLPKLPVSDSQKFKWLYILPDGGFHSSYGREMHTQFANDAYCVFKLVPESKDEGSGPYLELVKSRYQVLPIMTEGEIRT